MGKYLLKRILHGVASIVIVVIIVMVLIYSMLDRNQVFTEDSNFGRQGGNAREAFCYNKWEQYGYLDYVPYTEWLNALAADGEIDEETRSEAAAFGRKPEDDTEIAAAYVAKVNEYYESQGYEVIRLNAILSGRQGAHGGAERVCGT